MSGHGSAEPVARLVSDLRTGRIIPGPHPEAAEAVDKLPGAVVVDATEIQRGLEARGRPTFLDDDKICLAPPWDNALVCFGDLIGGVYALHMRAVEWEPARFEQAWPTNGEVDWAAVRWALAVDAYLGGRDPAAGLQPTVGPLWRWAIAVYGSGRPADLRGSQADEDVPDQGANALVVLKASVNFMNCRNVELVDPTRPRAEARRLERLGVTVHTINVFPRRRSTRNDNASSGQGVPLTPVVGHFAHYGDRYGRGKLFGKLEGKFWIPAGARGSAELGESRPDYRLRPEETP